MHDRQKKKMPPSNRKSKVRDEIDANLKRVYRDTLNEEVPDRLKQLLKKLKREEDGT